MSIRSAISCGSPIAYLTFIRTEGPELTLLRLFAKSFSPGVSTSIAPANYMRQRRPAWIAAQPKA